MRSLCSIIGSSRHASEAGMDLSSLRRSVWLMYRTRRAMQEQYSASMLARAQESFHQANSAIRSSVTLPSSSLGQECKQPQCLQYLNNREAAMLSCRATALKIWLLGHVLVASRILDAFGQSLRLLEVFRSSCQDAAAAPLPAE